MIFWFFNQSEMYDDLDLHILDISFREVRVNIHDSEM
jgi:hypothetical protein